MTIPQHGFRTVATARGSSARAGILGTLHGDVLTPVFMPVGTQATVKAQLPQTLLDSGTQVVLANTYHLLLRPGPEVLRRMGGIHRFMSWPRAVLTDSGGYQVFSLPGARTVSEEGATFRSYVDHKTVLLSPESSIATQVAIGGDIMMAFDHCVASTVDLATARGAADLTARWAARCLIARETAREVAGGEEPQALFGIVQGALFPDLRRECAARLAGMPFDGYAIGGLAVGESRAEREDVCALTAGQLPHDKPRYLMGVGTPLDLLEGVHRGVDMFDCIIPTQVAQRGGAFTSRGYLQLRRTVHALADLALDPDCDCPTCRRHSRAYLHHLIKVREPLGWQLLGQHNLHFYHRLMREMRNSILTDGFAELYRTRREALGADDLDNPVTRSRVRTSPASAALKAAAALTKGAYAVHIAAAGFASIRHVASGEIMHARTAPMDEARSLYVEQSGLRERLRLRDGEDPAAAEPLVIWDVGLGAAANAMAAILCYEDAAAGLGIEESAGLRGLRGLRILSFETDLDPLRLALRNQRHFPYLRHGGPATLLASGAWTSRTHPGLEWRLLAGDFAETMARAPFTPDLVYYDLFSGTTHPEAWTLSTFERLHAACAGRAVELFTYTASTAARVAMLGAGFWVRKGCPTDGRPESTIALTAAAAAAAATVADVAGRRHELLGPGWLERWGRSQARFPSDVGAGEHALFGQRILGHPQFR